MSELPDDTERDLAALADGSLCGERRERAAACAAEDPQLSDALAEQRRAVRMLAAVNVRAPESLHARVEQMAAEASRQRTGGRARPHARAGRTHGWRARERAQRPTRAAIAGLAIALACAAAALAVALAGGAHSSPQPSVRQTAALTLSAATLPAPARSAGSPGELDASVGGVAFPYWEKLGWRSSGARVDRLAGRAVTTVFYSAVDGRRVGYAIVSGAAPAGGGGVVAWRTGTPYRVLRENGTAVVTWQRDGHLCVMSGRGVDPRTLLALASAEAKTPPRAA